jgi:hypothetical protein
MRSYIAYITLSHIAMGYVIYITYLSKAILVFLDAGPRRWERRGKSELVLPGLRQTEAPR